MKQQNKMCNHHCQLSEEVTEQHCTNIGNRTHCDDKGSQNSFKIIMEIMDIDTAQNYNHAKHSPRQVRRTFSMRLPWKRRRWRSYLHQFTLFICCIFVLLRCVSTGQGKNIFIYIKLFIQKITLHHMCLIEISVAKYDICHKICYFPGTCFSRGKNLVRNSTMSQALV